MNINRDRTRSPRVNRTSETIISGDYINTAEPVRELLDGAGGWTTTATTGYISTNNSTARLVAMDDRLNSSLVTYDSFANVMNIGGGNSINISDNKIILKIKDKEYDLVEMVSRIDKLEIQMNCLLEQHPKKINGKVLRSKMDL